ncbi:MAG TPA: hypothetical protein VJP85_12820 [Candidatus Baltobacteraceae bacterium]|nr:hypothetical protein [Candidatus Baltobacteraceae bacterium]
MHVPGAFPAVTAKLALGPGSDAGLAVATGLPPDAHVPGSSESVNVPV